MKTLKLFNAVVGKPSFGFRGKDIFISEDGYVIAPDAMWAKDNIVKFYNEQRLSGNDLNKTFHKSFEKVRNSSRYDLYIEQIRHYMSTYGTLMQGEIYIPDEVLEVPDLKLSYKVISAYTAEEMTDKCLDLLRSGIALTEDTINDVLTILTDELKYTFTGKEGIRNKEAIIKIADIYGVIPQDTMEFFRYIIYRATGESLLIKSPEMIAKIKETNFNPAAQFNKFGLERLAEIFNRFKPLFLSFKKQCPAVINRISKLSKTCHKAMVVNPLSLVTHRKLEKGDSHWLDNATPFALFKALTACYQRMSNQTDFVYRIRNGKSWIKNDQKKATVTVAYNFNILYAYLATRFNLSNTKVFVPNDIEYALPTSEKMFVGNIPTGTKFFGDRLAVGMYWTNDGGANDIDLSAMNISGTKIGWNARYADRELTYSGDITNAPNGAVEYLHSNKGLKDAYLVMTNVFTGSNDCKYKIIVGRGSNITKPYMMDPNNLFAETECQSVQKQTVLGMLLPAVDERDRQSFVVLNFGAGQARVSGGNNTTAINALYQQWNRPFSFNELLVGLGADIVDNPEDADVDLSLDKLDKDSFTKLFK